MAGTIDRQGDGGHARLPVAAVVAAYNESERIGATLAALSTAFPGVALWVADDGSTDGTAAIAEAAGARVVRSERVIGKGAAMTAAARGALADDEVGESLAGEEAGEALAGEEVGEADVFLLCDGDLGESAGRLGALVEAAGPGACGLRARAPISGQRALRRATLEATLPFAAGYGMEVGMTIDAVRAGARVIEIELDLSHRATGRSAAGFAHRGRQLLDFARAYVRRR